MGKLSNLISMQAGRDATHNLLGIKQKSLPKALRERKSRSKMPAGWIGEDRGNG